jgi:hypothetical protein
VRHIPAAIAQRRLGCIEITVRIDEHEADAQRTRRGTGMLQAAEHPRERAAVGQQPHRKRPAPAFGRHNPGQLAVRECQAIPFAVLLLLVRCELDVHDRLDDGAFPFDQLLQVALLQIVGYVRPIRQVPFAAKRHLDEGHRYRIARVSPTLRHDR